MDFNQNINREMLQEYCSGLIEGMILTFQHVSAAQLNSLNEQLRDQCIEVLQDWIMEVYPNITCLDW
jgi:hypothetical protein